MPDCPAGKNSSPVAPNLILNPMKTITLSATFDGERIRLEEDFPLQKNARLLVTVLPTEAAGDDAFRDFWRQLSAGSLARAYASDEPEYTLNMVREPNPSYESR